MKKTLVAVLASAALACCLTACGNESEDVETGMANPVHETTLEGLPDATCISLDAPEGATDVTYAYIDHETEADGNNPVAQVTFTLDGVEYCYRAQFTNVVDIMTNVEGGIDEASDLPTSLAECTNSAASLAGMYFEWGAVVQTEISYCPAVMGYNEGADGFVGWLDVVPGLMYTLSADTAATQELLTATAEACFVPAQGEVG